MPSNADIGEDQSGSLESMIIDGYARGNSTDSPFRPPIIR